MRGPLASLVALLVLLPGAALADYYPPAPFAAVGGYDMPQAGTTMRSGPCVFGGAIGYSAFATAYLQLFDATSAPSSGDAPVWESASCTAGNICFMNTVPAGGIKLSVGAYLAFSSTGTKYTAPVGTSDGFYTAMTRP